MKFRKIGRFFVLGMVLSGLLIGCRSHAKNGVVIVAMDWSINTNHVAIITALKKSFYQKEGLKVQLIDFGKTGATSLVSRNQADIGLSSQGELTFAVDEGAPLLSVATLFNHNPSGFYSLDKSKIFSPKDLQNKIYGGWGSSMEDKIIRALIRVDGVARPSFENQTLGSSNILLALKNVDFIWGFKGWQGVQLKLAHFPFQFLSIVKYLPMLDDYSPILIVNTQSSFYKKRPDQIRNFLKATEEGARWTLAHPQEAVDFLMSYDETLSPELLRQSLKVLYPYMLTKDKKWGVQGLERYKGYLQFVEKEGLLKSPLQAQNLFSNTFLTAERS